MKTWEELIEAEQTKGKQEVIDSIRSSGDIQKAFFISMALALDPLTIFILLSDMNAERMEENNELLNNPIRLAKKLHDTFGDKEINDIYIIGNIAVNHYNRKDDN